MKSEIIVQDSGDESVGIFPAVMKVELNFNIDPDEAPELLKAFEKFAYENLDFNKYVTATITHAKKDNERTTQGG